MRAHNNALHFLQQDQILYEVFLVASNRSTKTMYDRIVIRVQHSFHMNNFSSWLPVY